MNKYCSIFIFLFIFKCIPVFAQIITMSGYVSDKDSNRALPGVSVTLGIYGTSTNADGHYLLLVPLSTAKKLSLAFSCIGYEKSIYSFNGQPLNVRLTPVSTYVPEVIVSGKSESILKKAIRSIPQNYSSRDFLLQGTLGIVHSAKDTDAYQYFYKNESDVKSYYSSYLKNTVPQIAVLYKTDTLIQNPKSGFNIRWVNGYTALTHRDYVHNRTDMLSKDMVGYKYTLNGKDWVNGNRVFVINFFSAKNNDEAGTLYIDTASFAFVRIAFTRYHVKQLFTIGLDQNTNIIDYQQINGKWYVNTIKMNSTTRHGRFELFNTIDYRVLRVDTNNVKQLLYRDVIPEMAEDVNIKPFIADTLHARTITTVSDVTESNLRTSFIPIIDTTHSKSKSVWSIFKNYLIEDNIRLIFGTVRMPFKLAAYQPLLGKNVSALSSYCLSFDMQLRIIKGAELFLLLDNHFNLNAGGIKDDETAYGLTYKVIFNKSGHPIYLSPTFGYSAINLSQDKIIYYKQKTLTYGINLTYEISPRVGFFVDSKYFSQLDTNNSGLLIDFNHFSIGSGFIFKLKL